MSAETAPESATPLSDTIAHLAERFRLAELYVFGSRASEISARVHGAGSAGSASLLPSDVDVGVRPLPGTSMDGSAVVALQVELEQALNVNRVDVVLLPDVNPYLALDVIRGERLYCANSHDQAEYELEVLRRAGDLAPFQRLRQQLALSRYG